MTNYTTLKLTDKQVVSVLAALHVYEQTSEGLTQEEQNEYEYTDNFVEHRIILSKLSKAGWNI